MIPASERLDPVAFRRACGRFATGVAVVAARHGDRLAGMTINSFASVSLDPPLVLWSLRNDARSRETFERAEGFAISILSLDQAFLARHFASGVDDIFGGVATKSAPGGLPWIDGAIAWMACETRAIHAGGDHRILVGEVIDLDISGGEPLLFINGRFAGGANELERP